MNQRFNKPCNILEELEVNEGYTRFPHMDVSNIGLIKTMSCQSFASGMITKLKIVSQKQSCQVYNVPSAGSVE